MAYGAKGKLWNVGGWLRLAAVVASLGGAWAASCSAGDAQPAAARKAAASARRSPAAANPVSLPAAAALVQEQLAAGEFGPARDQALATPDLAKRTQLLQKVAAAQQAAGDFPGADATAGYIPTPEERSRTRGETLRNLGLNGGMSGANFGPLMNLIQETVQPDTWSDTGGPGSIQQYQQGVYVDPNGMLHNLTRAEQTGELTALGRRAREADLNQDMARSAKLRLVSLPRLERAVAERVRAGQPVLETMQRLAGLTRITHVFLYPENGEIVIGGPAEGWLYDDNGAPVGRESRRPMMQLDDFVVVLRTFAPGGEKVFGCSINPRDENLKKVKDFVDVSNSAGPLRPGALGGWLKKLHNLLGLQDVVVFGVPADTRVSQVLVAADYRMKLIGVGKLDGGRDIPSYFDLLKLAGQTSAGAPIDALRWWMTMKYDSILHSPDRDSFELKGSSVQVLSENQFVNSRGQHIPTGQAEPVNRLFAQNFTKHYAELAQRDPIFADVQNIFDLGMVAALCRQEHLHERAKWELGVFAPGGDYRVAEVLAPRTVDSVINHRVYGGRDIVVQVAGGVRADVLTAARDSSLAHEDATLGEVSRRSSQPRPQLPAGRWWWDAAE